MVYSAHMSSRHVAPIHLPVEQAGASPQSQSPGARAYRFQLQRVDKLRTQLRELEALAQQQRDERLRWLVPLQQRERVLQADLVRALDAQLATDALGPRHRSAAVDCLTTHAQTLAENGDGALADEMQRLHDRHSRHSLAHKHQAAAQALREQLESVLGQALHGVDERASADEVLQAARHQWHSERDAARDKKQARAQARQAKRVPAPAQLQQEDAAAQLRRIYRQLASALHPDREADESRRRHKTALMSEANAAYERKDLVTLMRLQQQAALVPADAVPNTPDDQLATLALLLKQQVADLERERAEQQEALAQANALPDGVVANANSLKAHLLAQVQALEGRVSTLQVALDQAGSVASLKRWLNKALLRD